MEVNNDTMKEVDNPLATDADKARWKSKDGDKMDPGGIVKPEKKAKKKDNGVIFQYILHKNDGSMKGFFESDRDLAIQENFANPGSLLYETIPLDVSYTAKRRKVS